MEDEIPLSVLLETISPYLQSYGFTPKGTHAQNIKDSELKELASKWKIKTIDTKQGRSLKTIEIAKSLFDHIEMLDMRRGGRRKGGTLQSAQSFNTLLSDPNVLPNKTSVIHHLEKNYFGLPPYALNRTAEGIVYQCRKPYDGMFPYGEDEERKTVGVDLAENQDLQNLIGKTENKKTENHGAQRKVVAALRAMANNPQMVGHFVYRGGVEAVIKLTFES